MQKSDIYKINCSECDAAYVTHGQTRRRLETRLKDHVNGWKRNEPEHSSIAKHIIEHNHSIDESSISLIKDVNDPNLLDIHELHESMGIHKATLEACYRKCSFRLIRFIFIYMYILFSSISFS